MVLPCHYGLLCANLWEKSDFFHFKLNSQCSKMCTKWRSETCVPTSDSASFWLFKHVSKNKVPKTEEGKDKSEQIWAADRNHLDGSDPDVGITKPRQMKPEQSTCIGAFRKTR